MHSPVIGWYARHQRRIDWIFLGVFAAWFSYCVLDAMALLPGEPGFRPGRMVGLSGCLLIQAVASLFQPRFPWVSIALVVLSLAVLGGAFLVA